MKRLSVPMERMLQDAVNHGDPFRRIKGRSQHGGAWHTLLALQRRGLLGLEGTPTMDGARALGLKLP